MLEVLSMARWEQFEIWVQNGTQWEMLASFPDFDVASAVARTRSSRMRLVHSIFEDGSRVEEQTLAELGTIRNRPR